MENKVSINLFCYYSPKSFSTKPCNAYIINKDNKVLWEGTSNEIATFTLDKQEDIKIIYKHIVMSKKWKFIFMALLWLLIIGIVWFLLYYKNENNFIDHEIITCKVKPNSNYDLRMIERKIKVINCSFSIKEI